MDDFFSIQHLKNLPDYKLCHFFNELECIASDEKYGTFDVVVYLLDYIENIKDELMRRTQCRVGLDKEFEEEQ